VVVLECVEGSFCLNPKTREKGRREWVGGCNPMHGDGEKELVG